MRFDGPQGFGGLRWRIGHPAAVRQRQRALYPEAHEENMSKKRIPTWLLVILIPVGLLLVGIPGLWILASLTATRLHPNQESVPTVMHSAPPQKWATAAGQARQMVRASVAEQDLPGVSVAVGADGEVAWAEGFGFADLRTSTPVTPSHRFRIGTAFHRAHLGCGRPAAGQRPAETRPRASNVRACISQERVARDTPRINGAYGRDYPRRRRRGSAIFKAL